MDNAIIEVTEPPSAGRPQYRTGFRPAPPQAAKQPLPVKPKARRGRPSQEDYAKRVYAILRADVLELEHCDALAQLPGIQLLTRQQQQQRSLFPQGAAIQLLLDRAVSDVEAVARMERGVNAQRLLTFLRLWYREHGTVAGISREMGLSRSYIAHYVQPPALKLVIRRFLELAGRVDLTA